LNQELVEKVTRLIVEKLQDSKLNETTDTSSSQSRPKVKFWNHAETHHRNVAPPHWGSDPQQVNAVTYHSETANQAEGKTVTFWDHKKSSVKNEAGSKSCSTVKPTGGKQEPGRSLQEGVENPFDGDELKHLKEKTPARIGVGRAGTRPKTSTLLKFRYDHAAAVDAVYGEVNQDLLKELDLFTVNTRVQDKDVYIRRPDYGRRLSNEAIQEVQQKCKKSPTVQIIVSDGLSSKAIDENLEDVYLSLQQSLKTMGLETGTPFYIEKGRVAVMDDVGEILKPKVIVLLIGERPGLVSAESMSAYLCYEPRKGTIEADRMVISNIHKGGIPPVEAGAYLGTVIQKILKYEASGVALVQKEE
jgi:ethanolamine ammonia-lyase small subunit